MSILIERCICFAAQQSDVYDGLRLRFAENLKNKAIVCCVTVCDRLSENLKNKA
ncbi:hypothetical protein [uncultured Nostoc sp.]|uniref:hypothetical protein n=1 Tax=uncultured Nostoc sp. TaxID=340711 RepID=UPI0035CAB155